MSTNETEIALLRQRIDFLEQREDVSRTWKMRIYGWIIGPALLLFGAGLTIYGMVNLLEFQVVDIQESLKSIGEELGNLHDKIDAVERRATETYNAAVDVFNATEDKNNG